MGIESLSAAEMHLLWAPSSRQRFSKDKGICIQCSCDLAASPLFLPDVHYYNVWTIQKSNAPVLSMNDATHFISVVTVCLLSRWYSSLSSGRQAGRQAGGLAGGQASRQAGRCLCINLVFICLFNFNHSFHVPPVISLLSVCFDDQILHLTVLINAVVPVSRWNYIKGPVHTVTFSGIMQHPLTSDNNWFHRCEISREKKKRKKTCHSTS